MTQTFELDGTQDQSLAFVGRPQVSGRTSVAAPAAPRVVVGRLAYQDLALDVHRLCGSQELEGLESEAGISTGAGGVGLVGVVHRTAESKRDTCVSGEYRYNLFCYYIFGNAKFPS